MATFRFLVVCCIALMTVVVVNGEINGKPSIHLEGGSRTTGSFFFAANEKLSFWDPHSSNSFNIYGMKYSNGEITVPETGIYFVYCQLFYRSPNALARHRIFINGAREVAQVGNHLKNTQGTFYTGLSVKLNAGDKITCSLRHNSNLWAGPTHSFFGAFMQFSTSLLSV